MASILAALSAATMALSFFTGSWNCNGIFSASGKAISSKESFASDLGGAAVLKHHFDTPPWRYDAIEIWTYDDAAKMYKDVIDDNFGTVRIFTSPGWTGSSLAWKTSVDGKAQEFEYRRLSKDSYRVSYLVGADAANRVVDSLTCVRTGP